jgi:hypothetical protein
MLGNTIVPLARLAFFGCTATGSTVLSTLMREPEGRSHLNTPSLTGRSRVWGRVPADAN